MGFKYNFKRLLNSGDIQGSFERAKINIKPLGSGEYILETKKGTFLKVVVTKSKITIDDIELEFFLKQNNILERYLEASPEIFQEDDEDIKEIVYEHYKSILPNIKVLDENIYVYENNFYQLKSYNDIENDIFLRVEEKTGQLIDDTNLDKLSKTVYRLLQNKGAKYDIKLDFGYEKVVPLAFNNGTLYISKEGFEFKENHFSKDDNLFFKFCIDYGMESNGIVKEWFKTRFKTSESYDDRIVAVSLIGDLFVTNNYSQVMGYFWGAGGTGKSLLQDSLTNILNTKAVSNTNIKDVGKDFKTAPLFNSIINFSSEISRRTVDADKFKSIIARDLAELNLKFKNVKAGRPLAKWLSVANSLPTIEFDSGVKRRLLTLEVTDVKIMEHNGISLSKTCFEKLFFEDKQGLVNIIVEGIMNLFNFNFDLNVIYDEFANVEHLEEVEELNDPIAYFLNTCTEKTSDKDKGILKDTMYEAFLCFTRTSKGTGIMSMKSQTFKARIKETGLKEVRTNYIEPETLKRLKTPYYYPNIKFKEQFLKVLEKNEVSYLCFSLESLTRPLVNKEETKQSQLKPEKRELTEEELNTIFESQETSF